jgi:hypothetical protein
MKVVFKIMISKHASNLVVEGWKVKIHYQSTR